MNLHLRLLHASLAASNLLIRPAQSIAFNTPSLMDSAESAPGKEVMITPAQQPSAMDSAEPAPTKAATVTCIACRKTFPPVFDHLDDSNQASVCAASLRAPPKEVGRDFHNFNFPDDIVHHKADSTDLASPLERQFG